MAKLINTLLLIAFFLIAKASVSNCLVVQVTANGLTCSSLSPLLNRPILSGANAALSCDGGLTAINSTTTDATGSFTITVNNVVSIPLVLPIDCRVFVTLPANCTIFRLNAQVAALQSLSIARVLGTTGQFTVNVFTAV